MELISFIKQLHRSGKTEMQGGREWVEEGKITSFDSSADL